MARVTYTPIQPGDAQVTGPNATFTAIGTQTTNVDAQNFAEEGLDARVFESEIQAEEAFTPKGDQTNTTMALPAASAWTTVVFVSTFRTGAISVAANERLRVIFRLEFYSDGAQDGIPIDTDVQLRWRKSVGGVASVIGTTRRIVPATASSPDPVPSGAPARLGMMTVIDGPVELEWVEVEIRDASAAANTVQSFGSGMYGTIFKRVTV